MSEAESGFHHDSRIHDGTGCKIRHGTWYRPTAGWAQATYTGSSYWEVCEGKVSL